MRNAYRILLDSMMEANRATWPSTFILTLSEVIEITVGDEIEVHSSDDEAAVPPSAVTAAMQLGKDFVTLRNNL